MENKTYQIKIESILGGIGEFSPYFKSDEFSSCLGIDPDASMGSNSLLAPVFISAINNSATAGVPMWFETDPKDQYCYVYDGAGSVYTITNNGVKSDLGDLNDGGTSTGNGCAYYDNYIYFARDTTVARYGPLNGTPSFTDDYWVGTLGKTALSDTSYPALSSHGTTEFPNHVLHRHSDGRLYFADVVGNQGYIHYISTSKTTVEGDTDNGSTYQKLALPYGYYPIDIESYGDQLVIAIYEGSATSNINQRSAKIVFWDTISQNFNKVVDFPDPFISALQFDPVAGVLYVFSGTNGSGGIRVSRFIGGYSFEQVRLIPVGTLPAPGAVDSILNKIIFGGDNESNGVVNTLGTFYSSSRKSLFRSHFSTRSSTLVSSLKYFQSAGIASLFPIMGCTNGTSHGIEWNGASNTSTMRSSWVSQIYTIGQTFKIKKLSFLLANTAINGSAELTIGIDVVSTSSELVLNSSNSPSDGWVVFRPESLVGRNSFTVTLQWGGISSGAYPYINLPINVEYELIND